MHFTSVLHGNSDVQYRQVKGTLHRTWCASAIGCQNPIEAILIDVCRFCIVVSNNSCLKYSNAPLLIQFQFGNRWGCCCLWSWASSGKKTIVNFCQNEDIQPIRTTKRCSAFCMGAAVSVMHVEVNVVQNWNYKNLSTHFKNHCARPIVG